MLIPFGGGETPIKQVVDTDLNQVAKRKYMALEGAAFLRKMMDGEVVPQMRDTECLDMMVDVMSDMSLHIHVAGGFVRVGLKANLYDAKLDAEIVREAGHWWRELNWT